MLKPHQDAYGQMMLDFLRDGSGYEVVEHDDGFVGIGAGPGLYFADFDAWRQTERDAMDFVRGRVLDVGCGAQASKRFSGEHRSRIRYRTFTTPYFSSARMSVLELRELVAGTGWSVTEVLDRGEGIYIAVLDAT